MKIHLVGVDEVGRGCLFGPVIAAAVILGTNKNFGLKEISKEIEVVFANTQNVLAACDLAIVASGTATLEAAILSKPMVVIYKSNFFSNFILSNFFLKTKFISLPNILSQEKIVFELRQNQVTGREIYKKTIITLRNKKDISDKLNSLRKSLLVQDPSKFSRAIQEILS